MYVYIYILYLYMQVYIHIIHIRRGETAPAFSEFWKTVVFAIAKLLIHFTTMVELFPRKSSLFFMMSCNLQGIFSWKLAQFSISLTSPFASAKCDRSSPKGFLWSLANAIARPWCFASALDSLGCWLWSQDYMEWPILTASHSIDPTCVNLNRLISNSFFDTKGPFRVVAWRHAWRHAWRQPNLKLKDG